LAILSPGAGDTASAEVLWSSISTACTPDRNAIQGDRYSSSPDNVVTPKSGVLDPIVLICPVSLNSPTSPDVLSMTYRDSTGAAASALVQAQFIRVSRDNGARAVIATLGSNSFTQTTLNKRLSARFTHAVSPNFYYYVRIELDRSQNSETISSVGVALEKARPVSISVAPLNSTIIIGGTRQFSATGTLFDGSTLNVTATATWSSSATGVATIDQTGLATGHSEGSTSIRAKVGSVVGTTGLDVIAPLCGDGVVDAAEECDDGGVTIGDGCSASCEIEDGFECTGQPSVCVATSCPVNPAFCDDHNECTVESCQATNCVNTPADAGTPCSGGTCDGSGSCVP
jgi:cysteine-rich repeat protein